MCPSLEIQTILSTQFSYTNIQASGTIRAHVQGISHLAKSVYFKSEYHTILFSWLSLDLPLQEQINEPSFGSTLAGFFSKINAKWPIFLEKANRASFF
jgi:hypothetical protein